MTTISTGDLATGGADLEQSDGTKIAVFVNNSGEIEVWKDIDTTPTAHAATKTPTDVHGGGNIAWIHAAIHSGDTIWVVSACDSEQTRDVAAATMAANGTWSAWEEAYDYTQQAPTSPGCAISIDSSDYPHILVVDNVKQGGSNQDNVYYTERTGGSWATPTQIGARDTKTDRYVCPYITLRNSDYIEVLYYFDAGAFEPAYKTWTGSSWSGESLYTEGNANLGGVTATTGGTAYRYHNKYGDDEIEENNVATGYYAKNQAADEIFGLLSPALAPAGDRLIFYIDTGDDVHLVSNDGGGWTDEGDLQVGTYTAVIAGWSYNNLNNTTTIDYIYSDGTNVYWDEFSLTTPASTPPRLRPLRIWPRRM